MTDIIVYGASEHGKYTIDILERTGKHRIMGVIDDRVKPGDSLYGYPVVGSGDDLPHIFKTTSVRGGIVAIGDNYVRSRVVKKIQDLDLGFEFVTAIHPFTSIGRDVRIGSGTVIMAGAVINGSSIVGQHSFIATCASLDHDCFLGDFASLSPRATIGGGVRIGRYTTISLGACVIHGRTIGDHTVVGAGSIVIKDLPGEVVAYGSPCRVVRKRAPGEKYL